jgi:hypothetical protein
MTLDDAEVQQELAVLRSLGFTVDLAEVGGWFVASLTSPEGHQRQSGLNVDPWLALQDVQNATLTR